MASLNDNWLGFSLSPQELQTHPQNPVFSSDEISAARISGDGSCFHQDSANNPSLDLSAPFGILEAFNRSIHSQDWNMNDLEIQDRPKLENFLGHSLSHTTHQEPKKICTGSISSSNINYYYYNNNNSYNNLLFQENEATSGTNTTAAAADNNDNNNSGSIGFGLSMIKNWLRNNPTPTHAGENNVGDHLGPAAEAGAETLSLSMSTGSRSSNPLISLLNGSAVESCASQYNKVQQRGGGAEVDGGQAGGAVESTPRKTIDTFGQRTSIYRGVTRHRWTGRYEAHLWDNSCRREGQTRKGRQVYLGGYDKEDKAARAYDLAALKYWGTTTTTNFPISNYEKEVEEMKHMTRQEYVASLRRKSSGFSRGVSIYRGVTRHHQHGRWQARIGRVAGNKDLYLGTFSTQEEAAEAYDIAAIKFRGLNAVTNFEIKRYDVKSILESPTLPIGGAAKRLKDAENAEIALEMHRANEANLNLHGYGTANDMAINNNNNHTSWPTIAFHQPQPLMSIAYPFSHQKSPLWCKQEEDYDEIDHQLQLGNTHNFLQPSGLPNFMSLDNGNSGYAMPMVVGPTGNTVQGGSGHQNQHENVYPGINNDQNNRMGKTVGYNDQGVFGSTDGRNSYYHQHHQFQQSNKASIYDDDNNWNHIPTAVPTVHGASTFTVWNDA
ncbi:hypothetical protein OROGR_002214 [Orobanche gracilis]